MDTQTSKHPIVIALDGTSASGKSTNAKRVAAALDFVYVDTGAMYRTLAWYCLRHKINVEDEKAVARACARWKPALECVEGHVHLTVDGYYPAAEIRTAEVSAAVPHVAAVPKVRAWMKKTQRACVRFGNLVMEGRDIGTHVFPETDFKYYLDAHLEERSRRRAAEGVQENLAARALRAGCQSDQQLANDGRTNQRPESPGHTHPLERAGQGVTETAPHGSGFRLYFGPWERRRSPGAVGRARSRRTFPCVMA